MNVWNTIADSPWATLPMSLEATAQSMTPVSGANWNSSDEKLKSNGAPEAVDLGPDAS